MSDSDFWLIKTGAGEHWEKWKDQEIISVGWDVGRINGRGWDEVKEDIMNKFGDDKNSASHSTGHILSIAGEHKRESQNMEEGDFAVAIGKEKIDGDSVVCGVAKLGEYDYSGDGVDGVGTHTYQRDADYLYDDGPVKTKNLSEKFHQGGEKTIHLRSTRSTWSSGSKEAIEELVEELEESKTEERDSSDYKEGLINSYFEENKKELEESTEFNIDDIASEKYLSESRDNRVDLYCKLEDSILIVEIKSGEAGMDALHQIDNRYIKKASEVKDSPVKGIIMAEKFTEELIDTASEEKIDLYAYEIDSDVEQIS